MTVPRQIGRFEIVRRLGSGGFATVWLAHDDLLDTPVAIKVLADNLVEDTEIRRRFLAEGRFLRKVDSPHLVRVHDVGELPDGRPYLVLAYADGGTLADRLRSGPLPVGAAVDTVLQAAQGISALHRAGLLHRDVKPANLLFHQEPGGYRVVVGDLGLGKALQEASGITIPSGTPTYVAPEQVRALGLDERADVYSLGAVAYAALTGRPPLDFASLEAVVGLKSLPEPPSRRAAVPPEYDAVVLRALEPDRNRRWPTIEAFATALAQVGTAQHGTVQHGTARPSPSSADRRKNCGLWRWLLLLQSSPARVASRVYKHSAATARFGSAPTGMPSPCWRQATGQATYRPASGRPAAASPARP